MSTRFKDAKAPSDFIRVKGNVLLSKSDPDFFQKYLNEVPSLKRAFEEHAEAPLERVETIETPIPEAPVPEEKKKSKWVWLLPIMLLFTVIGSILWINGHRSTAEAKEAPQSISPATVLTPEQSISLSVLKNAVDRYKEINGVYPATAEALIQKKPNNWLSFVPGGLEYKLIDQGAGYRILPLGFDPNCSCKPDDLELAFYKETNQLALMQGDQALAVYPVASGKQGNDIPFEKSVVSERVVNPNGGKGAFGTRALALQDNYAIHGTNEESLVGQRVSHGCLRMKNADIEELYPYVSLGTGFEVKKGKPPKPLFENGLPSLDGKIDPMNESKTGVVYHWNG